MAQPSKKYFTLNIPEMEKFRFIVRMKRPDIVDYEIVDESVGWTTIFVPSRTRNVKPVK